MANLQSVRCECGGTLAISEGPKLQGQPVILCTECHRKFIAQPIQYPSKCDVGDDIPGGGAA